jgi:aspartyl-tRNA(Asn)/glutamyl-tRNA(Gln) amidotransferase subunit A
MKISEIHDLYKTNKSTPLEVLHEYKKAFDSSEKELNAYITPLFEKAIESSKSLGDFDAGKPLWGVPVAVKDNIAVKDVRLTCGSKILGNYSSLFSATVVDKLEQAGAIIVGKTNLDEFAMGSSGEYSSFCATKNPLDKKLVPGGSSSGSAAAVADGSAIVSLGSDTGGSVRQPATFCGLVGVRPTYGTVSRYGLVAFCSSLDQIGPIAKNVDDAKILLSIITGCDPHDSTSVNAKEFKPCNKIIGIPKELSELAIDADILQNLEKTRKILESKGFTFREVSLPSMKYSVETYQIIVPAECSANLSRFDGVRYGFVSKDDSLDRQYSLTRSQGFGDEVKRRILIGTYALSEGFYDAFYLQATRMRAKISKEQFDVLDSVSAIMLPTTPTTAFELGSIQDPLKMYACDLLTIPSALAGLPSVSVPSGFDSKNKPIGMQFVGQAFSESWLFDLAEIVEENR